MGQAKMGSILLYLSEDRYAMAAHGLGIVLPRSTDERRSPAEDESINTVLDLPGDGFVILFLNGSASTESGVDTDDSLITFGLNENSLGFLTLEYGLDPDHGEPMLSEHPRPDTENIELDGLGLPDLGQTSAEDETGPSRATSISVRGFETFETGSGAEIAPLKQPEVIQPTPAQGLVPEMASQGLRSLIVKFAPGVEAADIVRAAINAVGQPGELIRAIDGVLDESGSLQEIILGQGITLEWALDALNRLPEVIYAEPNWTVKTAFTSNDPYYEDGRLWGTYGDTTSPANQYGSQASDAWSSGYTGNMSTVVGVLDSGMDVTHPDLYLNVWLNQEEIPSSLRPSLVDADVDGLITFRDLNDIANAAYVNDVNGNGRIDAIDLLRDANWADGIDTDGNGFTDDLYGWDFFDDDNNPFEDGSGPDPDAANTTHGTHVAGTIAAIGGNDTGVAGVNWNVQVMPLRFLGPSSGFISDAIQALDYFTAESQNSVGQHFVATNNSWTAGTYSVSLETAIAAGAQADIMFVAAAGNGSRNNDSFPTYPATYDTTALAGYDAVISVASLTSTGALSSFSNYGRTSVDLGAPGSDINSLLAGGGYTSQNGTSMAAPHVAGAVALAASIDPTASAQEIRMALLESAIPTSSLNGLVATNGRLDIGKFIDVLLTGPPTQIVTIDAATDNVGIIQGTLTSGRTTDDTTPELLGTLSADLEAGQTVEIYLNDTKVGAATVTGKTWTYTLPTIFDGAYGFTAQVEDAGTAETFSNSFGLTVDTTAPVVTVDAKLANDVTPKLTGTVSEPAASVGVTVDGQTIVARNSSNGTWTLVNNVLSPLVDGIYDVVVTATDLAGNRGRDSTVGELVIDTVAPAAPTVNPLSSRDNTPTLTGSATLGVDETLTVTVDGTQYSFADGNLSFDGASWSLTVFSPLDDSVYDVRAVAADEAGNIAADTGLADLLIDTTAPAVAITGINQDTASASDFVTYAVSLGFSGTAEPGTTIDLKLEGGSETVILGQVVSIDGTWSFDHTATSFSEGTYTLQASARDAIGNVATTEQAFVVDFIGPRTVSFALDDMVLAIDETATLTITFSEAVTGFDVEDFDLSGAGGGQVSDLTSSDGITWTAIYTPPQDSEIDPAAITLADGTIAELVIDTAAPAQTVMIYDSVINENVTTILGTLSAPLSPHERVIVFRDGASLGTAISNGTSWNFPDMVLERASHEYTAMVQDMVGNQGGLSDPFSLFLGYEIDGTDADDLLVGSPGPDIMTGRDGDDTITGDAGNDLLDGGPGVDRALYSGSQSSYTLVISPAALASSQSVTTQFLSSDPIRTTMIDRRSDGDGIDELIDIEFLDFGSGSFDLTKVAWPTGLSQGEFESFIELYIALFNRAPDATGLNFWGTAFANGTTLEEMTTLFFDQNETRALYPEEFTSAEFVETVYDNVLGRLYDQSGFDFWVPVLDDENNGVDRDTFIYQFLGGIRPGTPDEAYLNDKVDIGAYYAVHKGMSDVGDAMDVMTLYDGTESSIDNAVAAIEGYYADALDPHDGAFLMPLVGVLDDPFAVA